MPGGGEHPGFEGVEAIWAEGVDAEAEVEFGGGEDAELAGGEGFDA